MSAYRYCRSCGAPLSAPTAREIEEGIDCYRCGEPIKTYETYADVIERLEVRITELEERVAYFAGKVEG